MLKKIKTDKVKEVKNKRKMFKVRKIDNEEYIQREWEGKDERKKETQIRQTEICEKRENGAIGTKITRVR